MVPDSVSQSCGPRIVESSEQLLGLVTLARRSGKRIGLVPTMGALHEGHLSLVDACRLDCDYTLTSVFVNPSQFGPGEDFERYPRDLATDATLLGQRGTDVVFAPSVAQMYGPRHSTWVEVEGVTDRLEGAHRSGHFRGVATVVLKLFNLCVPDVAFFGQKDYQQTLVIRRMVEDLNLPVEIRVCPTIREPDGLAMSSRNRYLNPEQRKQAMLLSRSLRLAGQLIEQGECSGRAVLDHVHRLFAEEPTIKVDYIALVDPDTLEDVERIDRPIIGAVAARVGNTRLIDNMLLASSTP